MNLFWWSNQNFNVASVLYAVSFLFYAGQLASDRKVFSLGGSLLARLGFLTHTLALVLRWADAGIGHPPWTNLYESLVFFSWGVMGIHLGLEVKMGFKFTGVFASALVFVAMGIASLHPRKEIEPLVPALQSWWLLFHVFMACIAYAFFLASSFISTFYLLKEKVRPEKLAAYAALVCTFFLVIAAGKDFFINGEFHFFKVVHMAGQEVIMDFKGQDGKPVQEFVKIPRAVPILWATMAAYLLSAILLFQKKKQNWGKKALFAAVFIHLLMLVNLGLVTYGHKELAVKSNPYRVAALLMTFLIGCFFLSVTQLKEKFFSRLPSKDILDRFSYQTVLLGFPFMTINLISGAIWAYYAWGRYWGWDPKETWALITWFVYAFYLHARILGGWKGIRTAVVSVVGFFIVIFTYLGVNLVVSGLHSYATG